MPFPLTIYYERLNKDGDFEDIEEESAKINKKDLIGATIKEIYTERRGRNTSDILLSLKDGRVLHIMPMCSGEGFEFSQWTEDQKKGGV